MIIVAYFAVLILNFIEVFRNKRNKYLLLLSVLILGLIFAGGTENTDMVYYKATFLMMHVSNIKRQNSAFTILHSFADN